MEVTIVTSTIVEERGSTQKKEGWKKGKKKKGETNQKDVLKLV